MLFSTPTNCVRPRMVGKYFKVVCSRTFSIGFYLVIYFSTGTKDM